MKGETNMKNGIFGKGFVIALAILFVGISFIPLVTSYNVRLEKYIDVVGVKQSVFQKPLKQKISSNITYKQFEYPCPQMTTHDFLYDKILSNQWIGVKFQKTHDFKRTSTSSLEESRTHLENNGNYTPHDPIHINKNADFTYENGIVSGNGMVDDPYIIEGWIINTTEPTGIQISHTTSYFIVRNCRIPNERGITFTDIANGTVTQTICNCSGFRDGVDISESTNIAIRDSVIYSGFGVSIQDSVQIIVDNCSIAASSAFGNGVQLESSSLTILSNLTLFDNNYGLFIADSHNGTISNCEVFSNYYGINIRDSSYQVLRGNSFHDNSLNFGVFGLTIEDYYQNIDTSNTVNGNPIYYLLNESNLVFDDSDDIGFLGLVNCNNITIENTIQVDNEIGVLLAGTKYSSISSSTFSYDSIGLLLFDSSNNIVTSNDFTASVIYLIYSPNNKFTDNTITYGTLLVLGETLEDYYQDIDVSNTINGKPVYYFVEENDITFSESEIGLLAFVHCNNIIVTDIQGSNNYDGILLVATNGIVKNSEFFNNNDGMYIFGESLLNISNCKIYSNYGFNLVFNYASDITITNCNISSALVGFDLTNSSGNKIKNCVISDMMFNAFQISDSSGNIISDNSIFNNQYGGINMNDNCWGNDICCNTISYGNSGVVMGPDLPISPHNNTIRYNDIHHMTFSIGLDSANDNKIYRNGIHDSKYGIIVSGCQNCEVNWNNIYNNTKGLEAGYSITVEAKHNWWGSKDGPSGIGPGNGDSIETLQGAIVLYEPWLKHPAWSFNQQIKNQNSQSQPDSQQSKSNPQVNQSPNQQQVSQQSDQLIQNLILHQQTASR